jgi:hypothetical protein
MFDGGRLSQAGSENNKVSRTAEAEKVCPRKDLGILVNPVAGLCKPAYTGSGGRPCSS